MKQHTIQLLLAFFAGMIAYKMFFSREGFDLPRADSRLLREGGNVESSILRKEGNIASEFFK